MPFGGVPGCCCGRELCSNWAPSPCTHTIQADKAVDRAILQEPALPHNRKPTSTKDRMTRGGWYEKDVPSKNSMDASLTMQFSRQCWERMSFTIIYSLQYIFHLITSPRIFQIRQNLTSVLEQKKKEKKKKS